MISVALGWLKLIMQPLSRRFTITPLSTQDAQIIAQIELRFGLYLEKLTSKDKLALRSVLSRYIYYNKFLDNYLISDAITDTMPNLEASICEEMIALEGISTRTAELLIQFVTDQQISLRN